MDGTLLKGDAPIPGLVRLFDFLQANHFPFIIATNNATKSSEDYQRKLEKHNVRIGASDILTAATATAAYLEHEIEKGSRLYMIGQSALKNALLDAGFVLTENSSQSVEAVVVGGDWTLTYEKIKHAVLLIQRGARLIGTNPDVVYPTEEGLIPETGTTLAALQAATGISPTVIGKPKPYLFRMCLERLGSPPDQTAVVGDRLETDILGGQRAGLRTILTTTGVDNPETIRTRNIHPDWVVNGLDELINLLANHT
jgi:4-nitrophenyl phosphatase